MDPKRYAFDAQRILLQGIQVATSMGHRHLEVEHLVVFLAKVERAPLTEDEHDRVARFAKGRLRVLPKRYSNAKPTMGPRLEPILRQLEVAAAGKPIETRVVWEALLEEPEVLRARSPLGEAGLLDSGDELPGSAEAESAEQSDGVLAQYTLDVTRLAHEDKLDPVFGRSTELRRVMETLGRKRKNNPLLLGEPGVGKTAIVEALARAIVAGDVPESLRDKRLLSLDLAAMLSGSKFRGEFEERLKQLVEALAEHDGEVLLFIDEIHTIVGAGGTEGGADAANLLKPALARGELKVIAATTLDEFKAKIETDPALERRFQPIVVDEPDADTALAMLRGLKPRYERHHRVRISDEALEAAVRLSIRYLADRRLPDKAIDLIDEAASRLRLEQESMPRVMAELRARLEQQEMELAQLGSTRRQDHKKRTLEESIEELRIEFAGFEHIWNDYCAANDRLAELLEEEAELRYLAAKAEQHGSEGFAEETRASKLPAVQARIHEARQVLHRHQSAHEYLKRGIDEGEVAHVLSEWAGMPVGTVLDAGKDRIAGLEADLRARVFGQEEAIGVMVRLMRRAQVGLGDPRRPSGVALFLGPSGVGKTELAKCAAQHLYGSDRLLRFDMSEFAQEHSVARLVGAPPGYVGHGEGGELTEAIRRRPNSLVLLDEIEKAHPKAWDLLLQVFDEGRLTDGDGRHVDCRSCFFVMTSNLLTGAEGALEGPTDEGALRRALTAHMRPEFVNRIQEVVRFHPLGAPELSQVLYLLAVGLNDQLRERNLEVKLAKPLREHLVQVALEGMGARSIQRHFDRSVRDVVVDYLFEHDTATGTLTVDLDEGQAVLQIDGTRGAA
ncbi:MAG: ATP-dependent Clp protease ATP-binding subunit [Planctomycetota bacterium]